jgi:hypothetical protein
MLYCSGINNSEWRPPHTHTALGRHYWAHSFRRFFKPIQFLEHPVVTLRIKTWYVLFYLRVWCISPCALVLGIKSAQYLEVKILAHSCAMQMSHLRETLGRPQVLCKVQPADIARFWLENRLKLWTLKSKCCIVPPTLQNTRMNAP